LVAVVAAAALLVASPVESKTRVSQIPWDLHSQGLPYLVPGDHDVWIEAINPKPDAVTVWRVDLPRLAAKPSGVKGLMGDVFPDQGAFWLSTIDRKAPYGLRLFWVDVSNGYRMSEKTVPSGCRVGDGGHSVVYASRLWFTCSGASIYVYSHAERLPTERLHLAGVEALLPASTGLWAATKQSLRAVAGDSKAAVISLPRGFVVAGDYASNVGWALAGGTIWAVGHDATNKAALVRLDTRARSVAVFPIVAPVRSDGYLGGGIVVAGDEIWLGDSAHVRLIRYSANKPGAPLGYIPIPGSGHANDAYFRVQAGAGAAWVEAQRPDGIELFRVTIGP